MKSLQPSFIAIRALLAVAGALLAAITPAQAAAPSSAPAGIVTQLDGPLLAQKADGRTRVIARGAAVEVGDTLVTGNGTYAEIRFADDSDAIMEPDTELTIDAFSHRASRTSDDAARWTLSRGGMRVTSGSIASLGSQRHTIATPYGTIGVTPSKFTVTVTPAAARPIAMSGRVYLAANDTGTMSDAAQPIFVAQVSLPPPPPPPPTLPQSKTPAGMSPPTGPPILAPGLHLQVTDGAIIVTNNGGTLGFQAGQFGFVPNVNQPPVIVPSNPNIQFVPPPSFNMGSGGPTASNGPGQGQATDCIVR